MSTQPFPKSKSTKKMSLEKVKGRNKYINRTFPESLVSPVRYPQLHSFMVLEL